MDTTSTASRDLPCADERQRVCRGFQRHDSAAAPGTTLGKSGRFLLRTKSDQSVLVVDEALAGDGDIVRRHRFRTTGRGNASFRVVGRFVRSLGWDALPVLWSGVRGDMG